MSTTRAETSTNQNTDTCTPIRIQGQTEGSTTSNPRVEGINCVARAIWRCPIPQCTASRSEDHRNIMHSDWTAKAQVDVSKQAMKQAPQKRRGGARILNRKFEGEHHSRKWRSVCQHVHETAETQDRGFLDMHLLHMCEHCNRVKKTSGKDIDKSKCGEWTKKEHLRARNAGQCVGTLQESDQEILIIGDRKGAGAVHGTRW